MASVSRVECFILVFYSVVYFAHLQIFSVLVHCWGIIYECQNTLRQSTLSPYTHRIVVVVSPQTSISSNNWVIMPSTKKKKKTEKTDKEKRDRDAKPSDNVEVRIQRLVNSVVTLLQEEKDWNRKVVYTLDDFQTSLM